MCNLCEGGDDQWVKKDDAHTPADGGELLDGETKDMIGADDEGLHINALKFKILFEQELIQARETGTLSQECFDYVWWLCRSWRGCTQEI